MITSQEDITCAEGEHHGAEGHYVGMEDITWAGSIAAQGPRTMLHLHPQSILEHH